LRGELKCRCWQKRRESWSRSTGELEAELQNAALVGTNSLLRDEDGVSGAV
jgi:hypothetical protein